jgi:ATP-dependent Clp endopeptidase proteolytic subunit ClpP
MQNWYDIKNEGDNKSADIFIYSEIGGYDVNAKSFIEAIQEVKDKPLNIYINSLGGSVFDGLAIYNALKNHKHKVTTKVQGIAASIASVIAMAGDEIEMAENSLFMIHNPFTMAGGDANELRKTADVLDKIREEIAGIYSKKSEQDVETLVGLMNAETWFNATETIDSGFANSITKAVQVENNYDISNFTNITSEQINSVFNKTQKSEKMAKENAEVSNETKNDETLLSKIKSLISNTVIKNDHEEGHEGDEDESAAEKADWAETYEELKDRVDNLENAIHDIEERMGMAEDEVVDKTQQLETANNEVENLTNEISKLKAKGTNVSNDVEPSIVKDVKDVDPNAAFFNAIADGMKKRV